MTETLLHLTTLAAWHDTATPIAPAGGDAFVHCSPDDATALAVANALFAASADQFVALTVDPARLAAEVRWEPPAPTPPGGVPDGTLFPHVYGQIDRCAVTGVRYLRRDPHGTYTAVAARPATAERLDLLPHPEGGWFRQTWAAPATVTPPGYPGPRTTATCIYFLLGPGDSSASHAVRSDEVWLWHRGGPLTLTLGGPGDAPGDTADITLGPDLAAGHVPQAVVPGGVWQAARPATAEETLVSCVVSPGFDFADFRAG
ncbi:MAG TPA: cupin domain-containing protein [Streptosporangiaceae bacterium]